MFHTPPTWSDGSGTVRFAHGALARVGGARRFDLGGGAVLGDVGLALLGGGRGHRRDGRGGYWRTDSRATQTALGCCQGAFQAMSGRGWSRLQELAQSHLIRPQVRLHRFGSGRCIRDVQSGDGFVVASGGQRGIAVTTLLEQALGFVQTRVGLMQQDVLARRVSCGKLDRDRLGGLFDRVERIAGECTCRGAGRGGASKT